MTKELEALEEIKVSHLLAHNNSGNIGNFNVWFDDLYSTLTQALLPPTVDEVCKALSEYDCFDEVKYDCSIRGFYSEDTICYLGIDLQKRPLIIFEYDLPPHLVTMIGKFYESLEEKAND